jgi:phage shock protein A
MSEIEKDDRLYEIKQLKAEIDELIKQREVLDRNNMVLDNKCTEYRQQVDFYKGKAEAYEYALRCIGGKYDGM